MKVIIGPEVGQQAEDGKIVHRQYMVWCHLHPFIMDNEEQPSPRDIDRINKTLMKLTHIKGKKGEIESFYTCSQCHQIVKSADVEWAVKKGRN